MNVTNLTDVVGNKRKEEVVAMLQTALAQAEEGASDVFILLKTDDRYVRYSTKIDNVTEVIAQLEVLKYDILRRMHE